VITAKEICDLKCEKFIEGNKTEPLPWFG